MNSEEREIQRTIWREQEAEDVVQKAAEALKKLIGCDVSITCRWTDGSYYKNRPDRWFVVTERFEVGPETTMNGAIEKMRRIYEADELRDSTGMEVSV